jgi:hypothetical protein
MNLQIKNNYLYIPDEFTNIKISIGESYNAPYSYLWLRELPNRIVFGFEPNPESINSIVTEKHQFDEKFPNRLRMTKNYIDEKKYFLMTCALDLVETSGNPETRTFYSTKNDIGCSSLLKPQNSDWLDKEIKVPCIDFYSFLKLIPPRFKYIEHVKIDAQGCDFRIIQSAKDLIKKIVFLTVECGNESNEYICDQKDSGHKQSELENYMKNMNFGLLTSTPLYANDKRNTKIVKYGICEPNITFINLEFLDIAQNLDCSLLIE